MARRLPPLNALRAFEAQAPRQGEPDDARGLEPEDVAGQARAPEAASFLNHHFPATDIPRQARALYLRNPVRVVPDSHYTPQPLRPVEPGEPPTDISRIVRNDAPGVVSP